MQEIFEILRSENYLLILSAITLIMVIAFLMQLISNIKLNKRYNRFMKKLDNSKDLGEELDNYMYKVDRVERQNAEIMNYCKNIDEDMSKCIQKVGIVRYSAFRDTGSDLSFTVALLNDSNSGVVFNGIYSMEMSNIYAKPIENGKSKYTLSDEENEAISRAIKSSEIVTK